MVFRRSKPSRTARRQFVLDAHQQLPSILALLGVCAGCAVLFVGAGFAFSGATMEDLTATGAGRLALVLDLFYFVAVAAGVAWVGVRLTHRVVGPSMVLSRAIRQMAKGDYSGRLSLRNHDFLQDVSEAMQELSHTLRSNDARRRVFHRQMEQFLDEGNLGAARELNRRQAQDDTFPVIDDAVADESAPVETRP